MPVTMSIGLHSNRTFNADLFFGGIPIMYIFENISGYGDGIIAEPALVNDNKIGAVQRYPTFLEIILQILFRVFNDGRGTKFSDQLYLEKTFYPICLIFFRHYSTSHVSDTFMYRDPILLSDFCLHRFSFRIKNRFRII